MEAMEPKKAQRAPYRLSKKGDRVKDLLGKIEAAHPGVYWERDKDVEKGDPPGFIDRSRGRYIVALDSQRWDSSRKKWVMATEYFWLGTRVRAL